MITKPTFIQHQHIVGAWRACTELLVNEGDRFNLTVHIEAPSDIDEQTIALLNPQRVSPSTTGLFDVANTIFPRQSAFHGATLTDFFDHYKVVYRRGLRRHKNAWGTYFQRLSEFGPQGTNQLSTIINAINSWNVRPRAAFVVHLSGVHLDTPRPLGAPCWQYGQFLRSDDRTLSMSVTYRSHDYFAKALGNFVGLGRLLEFVCSRTGYTVGTLTCLSTYAHLNGKRADARRLLGL